MAGGHGDFQPVKLDPSVERMNVAREEVYKTFQFTRRTTRLSLIWGLLVPVGAWVLLERQDLKWDWTAARRGEPIARWGKYALPESERNPAPAAEDDE